VVADCPSTQPVVTLLAGQGSLESVVTGPDRKLYFTDSTKKALMRIDAPGAQPVTVTAGVEGPGGLLPGLDGTSVVLGYGNSILGGTVGNLLGLAGLYRVDLATGERTTIATGLGMANGLARDQGGTIYASADVGTSIDKVVGNRVERQWATVVSANGLAVDSANHYLYAVQTFQPAAVKRISLTDPKDIATIARPPFEDFSAGLDGIAIDQDDNLYAAANTTGEVWRISTADGSICALARGLKNPSAVAFGDGGNFPFTSLYAVGFGGEVTEIPGAREPTKTTPRRIRLRVTPRRLRVRRRARIVVRVVSAGVPVTGVAVRMRKRQVGTTNARGIVRFTFTPRKRGRLVLRAAGQRVTLRVRPASRALRRPARSG
jgi:sugar lactone lactonase YvrE